MADLAALSAVAVVPAPELPEAMVNVALAATVTDPPLLFTKSSRKRYAFQLEPAAKGHTPPFQTLVDCNVTVPDGG